MTYFWLLTTHVLLLMSAAVSLGFLAGEIGLLSLAHMAFVGVGGYATAILTKTYLLPWPIAFLASIAAGAAVSLLVAFPILKLRKDAAILASIGAGFVLVDVFQNAVSVTRGPLGIKGIPPIRWPGIFTLRDDWMLMMVAAAWLIAVVLMLRSLLKTPLAAVLHAIRELETAATTCGHRTTPRRVEAFVLTAALAAGTGSIFAVKLSYIDPSLYTLDASILLLFMVIVGGLGRISGSVIGAAFLTILPESLRFLDVPIALTGHVQQALIGIAILAVMRLRPTGIVGRYEL